MNYDIKQSGLRIRQLRLKSGFTQEKIAEILDIDLLIQFSELYHVSLDYLVLGRYGGTTSNCNDHAQLKEDIEQLMLHLERFKKVL